MFKNRESRVVLLNHQYFQRLGVSEKALERLEVYHALLLKWQRAINLVSNRTLDEAWFRHFVDSAQLLPLIPKDVRVIADMGCGAGFPGAVLSILNPNFETHLIESDDKKCQFLKTVSRETQIKMHIHTARIESVYDEVSPDLVTARALASLEKLLGYVWPWAQANPKMQMLFLKGGGAEAETAEARKIYDFDVEMFSSETDKAAKILKISNLKKPS